MARAPDLDLSVIIVSWNVRDLLRACLASLQASAGVCWVDDGGAGPASASERPIQAEIILIDNASHDGTPAMVAAEFPWVSVLANQDNRGFTRGNNQGLALSRGRYVFFLNPDTEVGGDTLATLAAYMASHPSVGAVGPELRYGDGTPQSSRRRFPTLGMALCESTPLAWHLPAERNRWARRYHCEDRPPGQGPEPVDWLVGAALLVRRAALDEVGGFDEGYFMYSEELDWCRRAAGAGWQVIYLPGASITHHEGKSSEQAVAARHIRFQTSKVRYFRKYHGRLAAAALRSLILLMFAGEWLLEGAKWLAGSRRPLRAERMAAYGRLLGSGLAAGNQQLKV